MASDFPVTGLDSYAVLTDNTDNIIAAHLLLNLPAQSGNWDAGGYEIRSLKFQSDQATGTAPFIVASTTKVTNLNADTVDGVSSAAIIQTTGAQSIAGVKTFTDAPVFPADTIKTADIQDDAITVDKIGDNAVNTAQIAGNAITTARILDANVTTAKLATVTGSDTNVVTGTAGTSGNLAEWNVDGDLVNSVNKTIVQQVRNTLVTAPAGFIDAFVNDDTLPTYAETTEILAQSITPTNASNLLFVEVVVHCGASTANVEVLATLHKAEGDAIAAGINSSAQTDQSPLTISYNYREVAGGTSAVEFQVNLSDKAGHTLYVNGISTGRKFGGALVTSITITEIKA